MAPKRKSEEEEHRYSEYTVKVRRYNEPGLIIENVRSDELKIVIVGGRGRLTASRAWPAPAVGPTNVVGPLHSLLGLTPGVFSEFLPLQIFGLDVGTAKFDSEVVHHFCGQRIVPIVDILCEFTAHPVDTLPACVHFAHGKRVGIFSLVTTAEQATKYLLANWPEDSGFKPVAGAEAKMKKETYVPMKESRSSTWVAKKDHVGAWKIDKRPRPNVRIFTIHTEKEL